MGDGLLFTVYIRKDMSSLTKARKKSIRCTSNNIIICHNWTRSRYSLFLKKQKQQLVIFIIIIISFGISYLLL